MPRKKSVHRRLWSHTWEISYEEIAGECPSRETAAKLGYVVVASATAGLKKCARAENVQTIKVDRQPGLGLPIWFVWLRGCFLYSSSKELRHLIRIFRASEEEVQTYISERLLDASPHNYCFRLLPVHDEKYTPGLLRYWSQLYLDGSKLVECRNEKQCYKDHHVV